MTDYKNNESSEKLEQAAFSDQTIQQIHSQLMREKAEPEEAYSPLPMLIVFLCGVLVFWGGWYLAYYSGNFRSDVFDPSWSPVPVISEETNFDPIAKGKKLFSRQCQQCHQQDGMGIPGVYPPLNNSEWLLGDTDNDKTRVAMILLLGISGSITVKGETYDGNMPPVNTWKDRDIAAVLTYVRQNWDNSAEEISEETVKAARESIGDRKDPWSSKELEELYPVH